MGCFISLNLLSLKGERERTREKAKTCACFVYLAISSKTRIEKKRFINFMCRWMRHTHTHKEKSPESFVDKLIN